MTTMRKTGAGMILGFVLAMGGCSVDDRADIQTTGGSPSGLAALATTDETPMLGLWQGETTGGPNPGEPCTLEVSPSHSGDLSQLQFELSTAGGRKIDTTVSQEDASAILSGSTRLIEMRPQSFDDWLQMARHKLTSLAYAKLLAASEFVASLIRRDPSAAGTVVVRSAQIQWSILRSSCHFETRWTFDKLEVDSGPRLGGEQKLTCLYKNQPPGIFSLDHIQCGRLQHRS